MISLFSGLPRVFKHAGLWENFESKQYLVSNNMKEEWFVTLNFCFVKLVIVQIMLQLGYERLISAGSDLEGEGVSQLLCTHTALGRVGIFDYSLYCFGLKS